MKKLFLYARKSTDVEDKQVRSIDAQLHELREFADREGIVIIEELIEKQSAKTPGRPVFNAMLSRIEAGEADGILAWHPDRLARNSVDGGRIIYLLDTQVLKTLKFPCTWFENTPQGKLMLHSEFGFSKYYVDSLSENTKRGLREKVRRGEFPHQAPMGYINDYRTRKIIVDRERAPIVKEAFEKYATGTATLDTLRDFFTDRGVRSRNGRVLMRAAVSNILSNPFYYGHFRYRGEIYEGIHEPLISKALFDQVEAVLNRRWRYSPSTKSTPTKSYVWLLRCAECGSAITAEIQKGHTYYRCTKKNPAQPCSQPYVREELLDSQIADLLKPFALPADWAEDLLKLVKEERHKFAQSNAVIAAQKRAEIEKLNLRQQKLLDSFLDGLIDRDEFTAEKTKLMGRKKSLQEQSAALLGSKNPWLEPFQSWILTAKTAGETANAGSPQERKALAKKVFGSNLVLDCKKARGYCVKPWSLLAGKSLTGGMVRLIERSQNRSSQNFWLPTI